MVELNGKDGCTEYEQEKVNEQDERKMYGETNSEVGEERVTGYMATGCKDQCVCVVLTKNVCRVTDIKGKWHVTERYVYI